MAGPSVSLMYALSCFAFEHSASPFREACALLTGETNGARHGERPVVNMQSSETASDWIRSEAKAICSYSLKLSLLERHAHTQTHTSSGFNQSDSTPGTFSCTWTFFITEGHIALFGVYYTLVICSGCTEQFCVPAIVLNISAATNYNTRLTVPSHQSFPFFIRRRDSEGQREGPGCCV